MLVIVKRIWCGLLSNLFSSKFLLKVQVLTPASMTTIFRRNKMDPKCLILIFFNINITVFVHPRLQYSDTIIAQNIIAVVLWNCVQCCDPFSKTSQDGSQHQMLACRSTVEVWLYLYDVRMIVQLSVVYEMYPILWYLELNVCIYLYYIKRHI